MKKLFITISMLLMAFAVTACGKVPAGNVGVKVYLLGDSKGVDSEEVGPGRYWVTWNQELYIFPTFTQNYVWTFGADADQGSPNDESIAFQSKEGMSVSADIGISYNVDPSKVTQIFQKYRRGIDEITDTYLRNMVRDALVTESSTLPVDAIYGEGKANLMAKVEERVKKQVDPIGIRVERIYWIGEIRVPDQVKTAINEKLKATQMAQQRRNEVEQSRAEADKKIEEARGQAESILRIAEAQADANRLIAQSITAELVKYKFIEKWDGILSKVMSGDGGMNMFMEMKDLQQ